MEPSAPETREAIDAYIRANRETLTRPAIREALIAAGHEPAVVDAALDAADGAAAGTFAPPSGREVQHPRLAAAAIVVGAYAGVWILFAMVTDWNAAAYMTVSTWILGAVLGLFAGISVIFIAATKRLTAGDTATILGVATVPLILLLVIAGLCVPFTPFR